MTSEAATAIGATVLTVVATIGAGAKLWLSWNMRETGTAWHRHLR